VTRILAVYGVAVAIAACGSSTRIDPARSSRADTARDRATLDSIRRDFERAERAGDADRMYAHAAPDIIAMPPNRPPKIGNTNREWIREFLAAYNVEVQYRSEETVIAGDWAFDRGTATEAMTPKTGGPATTETAKYLWVYQRRKGEWKQARLIWNSNGPAPTAPALPKRLN
jgi:ketosteroid isomerase-like protein